MLHMMSSSRMVQMVGNLYFFFSRIADQNLQPGPRIKYNCSGKVRNEKGNIFVVENYVFTLITVLWSTHTADLTLQKSLLTATIV